MSLPPTRLRPRAEPAGPALGTCLAWILAVVVVFGPVATGARSAGAQPAQSAWRGQAGQAGEVGEVGEPAGAGAFPERNETDRIAKFPPLRTVSEVDLARYSGTWHEIARLPNRFQAHCLGGVTATYTLEEDGTVSVVNRCGTATGEALVRGVARAIDDSRARLEVSFLPGWLRWLPVGWGDYHVLALDEDYQWALVGEPSRRYLWVLAREPELETERLQDLLAQAARQGFAVESVVLNRRN